MEGVLRGTTGNRRRRKKKENELQRISIDLISKTSKLYNFCCNF